MSLSRIALWLACVHLLCLPIYGQVAIPAGFPDADSTGIAGAGLHLDDLTPTSGRDVMIDGTVIDMEDVQGQLVIKANNVTIRRSRITTSGSYGIRIYGGYTGTLIEDCLLIGSGGAVNITGANYTVRRCDISGDHDGIKLNSNCLVEDSYIHDQLREEGTHNDACQDSGNSTGWVLRHNTLLGPYRMSTAAIKISTDNGPIDDILVEENYISGGTFSVYCTTGDSQYGPPTGAIFRNNVFAQGSYLYNYITYNGIPSFSGNILTTGEAITENPLVNQPPIAKAGRNVLVLDADDDGGETICLDASGSHDNDGTIVSYAWSENAGAPISGMTPTLRLPVGAHSLDLSVTDDDGATDTDSVLIIVLSPFGSQPPVAMAGKDFSVIDTDRDGRELVTLNASGSYDSDGTIVSYTWREGSALVASEAEVSVSLSTGVHQLVLEVTDNDGRSDLDVITVTVESASLSQTYQCYAHGADRVVHDDGSMRPGGETTFRVGGGSAGLDGAAVMPFVLPELNPEQTIVSATLTITLNNIRAGVDFGVDLYGLPFRSSQVVLAGDFYEGPYGQDAQATAIQDDFATPATPQAEVSSNADRELADYLLAQYDQGAIAGDLVFLRLSPDVIDAKDYAYYTFTSADGSPSPLLTIVTGPQTPPLPGDCDGDGDVDIADFVIFKQNYGSSQASWSTGDFNGDATVDIEDFVILKQHYGMTTAESARP